AKGRPGARSGVARPEQQRSAIRVEAGVPGGQPRGTRVVLDPAQIFWPERREVDALRVSLLRGAVKHGRAVDEDANVAARCAARDAAAHTRRNRKLAVRAAVADDDAGQMPDQHSGQTGARGRAEGAVGDELADPRFATIFESLHAGRNEPM